MYQNLLQVMTAVRLMARAGGIGINELAQELNITVRSVYRLLDKLEELHYPIYDLNEGGKERRYHLADPEATLRWWLPVPDSRLNTEELALLSYLLDDLQSLPGLESTISSLRKKITLWGTGSGSLIPLETGPSDSIIRSFPLVKKKAPPEMEQTINSLIEAIQAHQELECTYQRPNSPDAKTFVIHPITLFDHDGGLYVLAFVPKHSNDIRMAVERIVRLSPTGQSFNPPQTSSSLEDPFGIVSEEPIEVRLLFSAKQAFYIRERDWPKEYELIDRPDGDLELRFTTVGSFEVKRWVLSMGSQVEILSPDHLRKELIEELNETIRTYNQ